MRATDRIEVRPVSIGDLELLFGWANDPTVRENSFTPDPIPADVHERWLASKLASEDVAMWLLQVNGVSVGQVRYEREGEHAEVSISIGREHRGRGLATELLVRTADLACARLPVTSLLALVIEGNDGSLRAFERAGYERVGTQVRRGRSAVCLERRCMLRSATG